MFVPQGGYVVREFVMTHRGVSRTVYQVHFTDWPDHGIPSNARYALPLVLPFAVARATGVLGTERVRVLYCIVSVQFRDYPLRLSNIRFNN